MALSPGQVIDQKYRVVRLVGEGGMGTVYEVEHTFLGRHAAIKVLGGEFAQNEEAVRRFYREAQAAARIGHENICEVSDVGQTAEGLPYIVMQLLQGQPLSAAIAEAAPFPVGRVTDIANQVLEALGAAHAAGIVHRDMKPDNIFLTVVAGRKDFVKLLDFGISKIRVVGNKSRLTADGMILGTPQYMSPEQARGDADVDGRADIWAVGVILFEMLTGRLPFEGDNYNKALYNVLTAPIPRPRSLRPGLSAELEVVLLRALDRDLERRFRTTAEFSDALLSAWMGSTESGFAVRELPSEPPPREDEAPPPGDGATDIAPAQALVGVGRSSPTASFLVPGAVASRPAVPAGADKTISEVFRLDSMVAKVPPSSFSTIPTESVLRPIPGLTPEPPTDPAVPLPARRAPRIDARPEPSVTDEVPTDIRSIPEVAPSARSAARPDSSLADEAPTGSIAVPAAARTPRPAARPEPSLVDEAPTTLLATPAATFALPTASRSALARRRRGVPLLPIATASAVLVMILVFLIVRFSGSAADQEPTPRPAPVAGAAPSQTGAGSPAVPPPAPPPEPELPVVAAAVADAGPAAEASTGADVVFPDPDAGPKPGAEPATDAGADPGPAPEPEPIKVDPEAGANARDAGVRRPVPATPPPDLVSDFPEFISPPSLGMGTLTVVTVPTTEVFVDGASAGRTPIYDRELVAGSHRITFMNEAYGIHRTERMVIQENRNTLIRRTSEQLGATGRSSVADSGSAGGTADAGTVTDAGIRVRPRRDAQ
ncbi:MAG: protein kinase [Deltaproteobacteria bacterium]|nr:protein kinase [Deltaproteobacteria bacterium]